MSVFCRQIAHCRTVFHSPGSAVRKLDSINSNKNLKCGSPLIDASNALTVLDGFETDHRLVGSTGFYREVMLGSPGKDYRRVPRSIYSLAPI